jgi:hypothetical protein
MTVSVVDIATAPAWRPVTGDNITGAVAHREVRKHRVRHVPHRLHRR